MDGYLQFLFRDHAPFFFPKNVNEYYWISDRDGYQHVYRYDYNGKMLGQVTKGDWDVMTVESVDPQTRLLYYTSTEASGLERHLYKINLDGSVRRKLPLPMADISSSLPREEDFYRYLVNTQMPKQVEIRNTDGVLKKAGKPMKVSKPSCRHMHMLLKN